MPAALPKPSDLLRRQHDERQHWGKRADRGADGQAMKSRPSAMVEVPDPDEEGDFRKNLTTVRRYSDKVYDRLWAAGQFTDRQHEVAQRLDGLHTAGGLGPKVTARYGPRNDQEHEQDIDFDPDEVPPRDKLRKVMRTIGPLFAGVIEDILHDSYKGHSKLATTRAALDRVADIWGLPMKGVGDGYVG